jgi:ABC-type phosphate transport system auxiliary subunit
MSKIQTQPIEEFINRVKTSKQRQEKIMSLSMQDAEKLSASLSQVMTRLVSVQEEIIEALKTAKEAQTVSIEMDGGVFNKNS